MGRHLYTYLPPPLLPSPGGFQLVPRFDDISANFNVEVITKVTENATGLASNIYLAQVSRLRRSWPG